VLEFYLNTSLCLQLEEPDFSGSSKYVSANTYPN
jgi:hypothetical protein